MARAGVEHTSLGAIPAQYRLPQNSSDKRFHRFSSWQLGSILDGCKFCQETLARQKEGKGLGGELSLLYVMSLIMKRARNGLRVRLGLVQGPPGMGSMRAGVWLYFSALSPGMGERGVWALTEPT